MWKIRSEGMSYGPKRKMTPEHNTTISAIGALSMSRSEVIFLTVYHNRFAKIPLRPARFAPYGVKQFELEEDTIGRTSKWREITFAVKP